MTFDELLDHIIELLQRRGRVTYRALKRRFDLDDEYLEDLKGEILFAHPQARDEDGQGLVWISDTELTPEISAPTPQPPQAPDIQETASAQAELPRSELHPPDAERRQLTVMFCDLADSTKLSGQLDPEDLRDVIRSYQETAARVILHYEGHIAQYLGDGLLVYFGWPQAHEDDAQRSVHAGLGIIDAMATLNAGLEQDKGVHLTVRIGIHTGPVVVGEMGGGGRHEQLALGETTNIAARLEGLAQPNTVLISDTTSRLIEGYFTCDDLGTYTLRGVATPMQVYRVRQATHVQGRLDAAMTRGLTPLVGRETEVTLLRERWAQVKDNHGHVVLLSGEAGIGKSRLVQVLKDHVAEVLHTRLECRSSPYYQNSALYPMTDLLQRTLQWQQGEPSAERLVKLEEMLQSYRLPLDESVPLFASLLSLAVPEERYPPLTLSPQQQRQKTLESLVALLLEQTECQPVLFILEDLHWTDPSTLELLNLLLDQVSAVALLVLLTCRPEFEPPWGLRSHLTPIALNRFTRPQVEGMVEGVTGGKALPAEVVQQIVEKTDGVPLFVEELTKSILESGMLHDANDHYELAGPVSSLTIPTTLQDSLMARLDRLSTAKGIAQLGATIGRQFSYDLLKVVASQDELVVWQGLVELVRAEVLTQRGSLPDATFTFRHALIQETAYQSLLRRTRQQYHSQIVQVLVDRFPEIVETQPELLAHHYTEAGLAEPAVGYWQQAGELSNARSAFVEAIAHLTKGLAVLQTLPDTAARAQRELMLQLALATALGTLKSLGVPERGRALTRAYELCQQVGDTVQLLTVLGSLATWHREHAEIRRAQEIAAQRLTLAQRQPDVVLLMQAHHGLAMELYFGGAFTPAHDHMQQALALARRQPNGPIVSSLAFLGRVLWMLGYPDQALTQSHQALTLAQERARPEQLATVLYQTAEQHWYRREPTAALQHAEAALALATEQGFGHSIGHAMLRRGWALAAQGRVTEGLAELRQGLAYREDVGALVGRSYDPIFLADVYVRTGQVEEGLHVLAEMRVEVDNSGFHCLEAEIYRLTGELLLQQAIPNAPQATANFEQALEVARHQHAKSWELRAATSLARLWQAQGKCQAAYALLAPVYGWFTEGFDTTDLQEAKALLDELA